MKPRSSLTRSRGSPHSSAAPGRPHEQRLQREGEQRYGEADLVELEVDGPLDAPAQSVRGAHAQARGPAEQTGRGAGDGYRGDGEQGGLREEQCGGAGEDPVQGCEHGDDGAEVVAEDVGAGALEVGDGRLEVRVRPDRLLEDAQVPGGGFHAPVAGEGEHGVGGEQQGGQCVRLGAAEVPARRVPGDGGGPGYGVSRHAVVLPLPVGVRGMNPCGGATRHVRSVLPGHRRGAAAARGGAGPPRRQSLARVSVARRTLGAPGPFTCRVLRVAPPPDGKPPS